MAETGFPGIIVFVAMIATVARAAYVATGRLEASQAAMPARAMGIAVLAGIAGFIVSGTFLTQGFTWPVYVLLALGSAVSHFAKREGAASQNGETPVQNAGFPAIPGRFRQS
jgi:O-antigen ligase